MTDSTYKKADLHIHTPASMCYYDKSVTPAQIIDIALETGLNIMAITDHNSFEAVDDIREAGNKKGICVFPGIELSTKSGHFIALFEIDTSLDELREILSEIQPDTGKWGDATHIVETDTLDIIELISTRNGIVIAAHIERWPSGILESGETSHNKMDIIQSPYLSALEITVPDDRPAWNSGKMYNYPRKIACVQSSDAHNIDEIGRRPVYIKVKEYSLDSLKSALKSYEECVFFPDDIIKTGGETG